MHMHTLSLKQKLYKGAVTLIMAVVAACSISPMAPTSGLPSSPEPEIVKTAAFTLQPSSTSTSITSPTSTPTIIPIKVPMNTFTSTQIPSLNPTQVAKTKYDWDNFREIWEACWSNDSQTLYYAISLGTPVGDNLEWFAYDLASSQSVSVDSPPKCYHVPNTISPSGRYYFENINVFPDDTPGMCGGAFDIWLVDNTDMSKERLLEDIACGVGRVQWNIDETVAVINFAWEGPSPAYVVDLKANVAVSLSAITKGHPGDTTSELSPDGSILVVYSYPDAFIQMISLSDGALTIIPEIGVMFMWSLDSDRLYYWSGPSFMESDQEIRVYDLSKGKSSAIIDKTVLDSNGLCANPCRFAISPDGVQAALWWSDYDSKLWLISLP